MDVVDFHSHILPHADHGSKSLSTSLQQLKLARECGVSRIIATPHFYPQHENPEIFLKRRKECYERLKGAVTEEAPDIRLGAEVLICENICKMPFLDDLCIEGTKALLVELPFAPLSREDANSVKGLIDENYTVILAHADRYAPKDIELLLSYGAKIQLNASSICHIFGIRHLKKWISQNKVAAIGSDIHGADEKAYKFFKKAKTRIKKRLEDIKKHSDLYWN